MMRKAVVLATVALVFGPACLLLSLGVVMNPAAQASCLGGGGVAALDVAAVPDSLVATRSDGTRIDLDRTQLSLAATIIGVGNSIDGVGRDGVTVALMAALTESTLRMLSNVAAFPSSASLPHDGDGADHDSLGVFQMRPSTGWGSVAELMDPSYQARSFFGGPTGPHHGSPRGLLDIPGWQSLSKGEAAQAVEVSAHPDRYQEWEPVAQAILDALTTPRGKEQAGSGASGLRTSGTASVTKTFVDSEQVGYSSSEVSAAPLLPETGRVVFPLPAGTWVRTSGFGMRVHPVTGVLSLHTGVDFAAPAGTHILAAADGRVAFAGPASGYGNLILIEHTIDGQTVASGYAHMYPDGVHVHVGETVSAGQYIADVGMAGYATGPHLHFEIRPGGASAAPIDPEPWLAAHDAVPLDAGTTADGQGCGDQPGSDLFVGGPASAYPGDDPDHLVDDPTTGGQITERTAWVLAQVEAQFSSSRWACWSPRPGDLSEHPLGRACDGTFGNSIGTAAAGPALDLGWKVTNWLKTNAQTLGVEYLIWQGHIWSVARSSEGWRTYDGGGMHDPNSVTGGHYDHLHFTVDE